MSGTSGYSGDSGSQGESGASGFSGQEGPTGAGTSGFSGFSGSLPGDTENFMIDGGGMAVSTGEKGNLVLDYDGVIEKVTLVSDMQGTMEVDIWKRNQDVPLPGNTITGTNYPELVNQRYSSTTDFSGWSTTTISSGDVLAFYVVSNTTITRATIALMIRRV